MAIGKVCIFGKSDASRCGTHLLKTRVHLLPKCGTGGLLLNISLYGTKNGRRTVRFLFTFYEVWRTTIIRNLLIQANNR